MTMSARLGGLFFAGFVAFGALWMLRPLPHCCNPGWGPGVIDPAPAPAIVASNGEVEERLKAPTGDGRSSPAAWRVPVVIEDLGRYLFNDQRLSAGGKVSCATCHDPEKSFADGVPQSKGVLGIEVGRNSPSLWAVKHVAGFPAAPDNVHLGGHIETKTVASAASTVGSSRSGATSGGRSPSKALSLADRCLAPIENPVEMGTTVDEVVEVLKRDATLERRFDEVFGGQGIGATADRLGLALAAFLSSLEPPNTPYHEFVGGREAALTAEEKAGLAVFRTRGRCDACHCGPGFTDGLVHAAQPANGIRLERTRRNAFAQMRELARTQRAAMLQAVPQEAPGRSRPAPGTRAPTSGAQGYGGVTSSPMVQTLSLWDVARTAPYFRDGSVTDLSAAVRTHIAELQAVRDRNASRRLPNDQRVRQMMVTGDFMAATLPESLRAQWPDGLPAAPEALDKADVSSLVAFLKTLSPRAD